MSKFNLFGRFTVMEGEQEKLVDILLEAANSLRDLVDCEIYVVSTVESEPNYVYVYEVWKDAAAHQASLTLESTQTLIQQAKPIITGMERLNTMLARGGKGMVY